MYTCFANRPALTIIAAGAGWSADSGLKTFEQTPNYLSYATHSAFEDPVTNKDAFAFWSNTAALYKSTQPHAGYAFLKKWLENQFTQHYQKYQFFLHTLCQLIDSGLYTKLGNMMNSLSLKFDLQPYKEMRKLILTGHLASAAAAEWCVAQYLNLLEPSFIVTSNIDTHFHKAGFLWVYEMHGNNVLSQCCRGPSCGFLSSIQKTTCELCHSPSRPNVLLFQDCKWVRSLKIKNKKPGGHCGIMLHAYLARL